MSWESAERVLILEDEPGVALLQRKSLERAGYHVQWAASIKEARSLFKAYSFDLLILDFNLPDGSDGLTFYKEMQSQGLKCPVIMVTGKSEDRTVVDALRAGVRDYVMKSVEYLDYLPEAVRRVLSQERESRERMRAENALREAHQKLEAAMKDLQARTEELRSTTQQLWQSAKLASVGELAASIAHELNNPLGTISLRLESLLDQTSPDDPRRPALEIVEGEIERMAKLITNLLQFSRSAGDQISTVHLPDEVMKTCELVEYHLRRRGVAVGMDFAPDVPTIIADRQKLRQVFLNLYTNAADAMPKGGRLTTRVFCGESTTGVPSVVIEVADTGVGIPHELLPRVMDSFFTTKEEGKGTGLGLAICRRIVQDHRGTMQIESHAGKGTIVRITLPMVDRVKHSISHD